MLTFGETNCIVNK